MSEDSRELKNKIAELTDEQLVEMVTTASGEYRPEAILYAKAELEARGVDFNTAPEDEPPEPAAEPAPSVARESASTSACLICGGRLRPATMVAEKELTIVFADNREERFVKVIACSRCGDISLAADYSTDVQP